MIRRVRHQLPAELPRDRSQVGARILGEIGDDRSRFATAGGLKAYAGSAPVTRAFGKRRYVGRRFVKNNRLNHVGHLWAFASISGSSGADAAPVQPRMLGQLHHCLLARVPFDEAIAFPPGAAMLQPASS